MDANKTRFHLLMGRADWEPLLAGAAPAGPEAEGRPLAWDEGRQSLSLTPLLFRFRRSPRDVPPRLEHRRGAARDGFGNWYWIDAAGTEIRVLERGAARSRRYWPVEEPSGRSAGGEAGGPVGTGTAVSDAGGPGAFGPAEPPAPERPVPLRGLAITEHHYLVAGTLQPAGLLLFDLHAGGPPRRLLWPAAVDFAPLDMAPAPGGGLWVLDGSEPARYWALDRNFGVVAVTAERHLLEPGRRHDFQPVDDALPERRSPERWFPAGVDLDAASPPLGVARAAAIESLSDGSVLVLDVGAEGSPSAVLRFRCGEQVGRVELALPGSVLDGYSAEDLIPLRAYDIAFVPGEEQGAGAPAGTAGGSGSGAAGAGEDPSRGGEPTGTLYVAAADGNQVFAFTLRAAEDGLDSELQLRYLPMRSFGGKGLVAAEGAVYYDLGERWWPLVEQERPRYHAGGSLTTPVFDGREPGCPWHRVFLDACIPGGAAVRIESRAGEDPEALADLPWREEPAPYLRSGGAELPYYRPFSPPELGVEGTGTWETLLQSARGRYLQLRLTLMGTGRNTPRVRALRVYYPRFSYVKAYLPDLYQSDEASADFLERFLANPEGLFTALEDRIVHAQALLDVRSAPAEFLEWLAGWFGVALEASWDEGRKRLFIAHAAELFAQRGTPAGVIRAIRLATDPCPTEALFTDEGGGRPYGVRIVERFLTRRAPGVVFGDATDVEGPGVSQAAADWSPAQGADELHQRYQRWLEGRYGSIEALNRSWGTQYRSFGQISLPPTLEVVVSQAEVRDLRLFLRSGLGFLYEPVVCEDLPLWQRFLAHRYRQVQRLNEAWQLGPEGYERFGAVPLPERLPEGGRALQDWIQFVSVYLPAVRSAHRFTVLVPTRGYGGSGPRGPDPGVVRRVVALEKPAHTEFAVKEYWAAFRVGEARVGLETVLDQGARLTAILLGAGAAGEGYLAHPHPWNVTERMVIGRDRLGGA